MTNKAISAIAQPSLIRYDAARQALAEARSIDEVQKIRDEAERLKLYARQAKDKSLEANAAEIRIRATRRLGELIEAQRASVGLNRGAAGGGKKAGPRGSVVNPRDLRPTLASQGIDKRLANQARVLGSLSDDQLETVIADTRAKVARAIRNAVREVEILQDRETYRPESGGTVADLVALAAEGRRFSVIYADPPWDFRTYSGKGKQRSAERHYDCLSLDDIKRLPVSNLAAEDCALLLWAVEPEQQGALDVIRAWGFELKTTSFCWVKCTPNATHIGLDGTGLHWGMGYHTRANIERCLLATRGSPQRLAADVHQVVIAPVGEHSAKPDEVHRRIERLYGGPYLELFARRPRLGWWTWGNEIQRTANQEDPR